MYADGILKATCKLRVGVGFGKFPIVRGTSFRRCCNFEIQACAANSEAGIKCEPNETNFLSMFGIFRRVLLYLKVLRLRPLVVLIRAA